SSLNACMRRSQQAFSAPSKQTQSSNAKDELSSTASINASSTTLIPSPELLASKPRDSTLKREQNSDLKQTQSSNAKDELSSTASINASSTTLIPSPELLASKPRDSTLKREQNSCYEHDNGLTMWKPRYWANATIPARPTHLRHRSALAGSVRHGVGEQRHGLRSEQYCSSSGRWVRQARCPHPALF